MATFMFAMCAKRKKQPGEPSLSRVKLYYGRLLHSLVVTKYQTHPLAEEASATDGQGTGHLSE